MSSFVCCDVQGHGRLSEGKAGFVGSPLRELPRGGSPRGCCHRGKATTGFFGNPGAEQVDLKIFLDFSTKWSLKGFVFFGVCGELPKRDAVFSSIRFFRDVKLYGCKVVILCLDFSCVIFKDCLEQ